MGVGAVRSAWFCSFLAVLAVGCSGPSSKDRSGTAAADEAAVRETFTAFQKALKDKNADKLWDLLDADSRADADRRAGAIQAEYARASAAEKTALEKKLGLPGAALARLAGKDFLKTNRFLGKVDEVPDSKLDKVTVQGDKATVAYTEPDNEKETIKLVRAGGTWKLIVSMP